ncbi:fimbria major subunit [Segatella copri]|nr:fimbria major subunit [Segatella copri]
MFKIKTITLSLLALLLVMSFASCASDTASDSPLPSKDMKTYLQVRVTVDGSGDTRASRAATGPQGGEEGDGRETGTNHENDVNSLTVLLYKSDKADLSQDDATIDYVYTFTNLNKETTSSGKDATYTTVPREIDAAIVGKNYHVLVIANAGDMTSKCQGKTISEIRDMQMDKVCTRNDDIANFSDFVMSSKKDAKIDFSGKSGSGTGTESDPYVVNVDIERLAARIDIIPNATFDGTSQGYYYNVMDGTNVIGGFKLESVTSTKVMTKGEYLIKRVSSDAAVSTVTYYGEEEMNPTTKASTNYVVCPWTKNRTGLTLAEAEGPTSFYNVKKTTSTSTTDPSYILDYVMENTTTDNKEDNSTGLIFKGKYYESSEWDATNKQPKAGKSGTDKYYTYTIRHSDPTGIGSKTDPMYYGIVRNNIYRVRIDGITGKGPDGMKITLNVRKWATYTHEETTM